VDEGVIPIPSELPTPGDGSHGIDGIRKPAWILYDGGCGLCHAAVRFVLARDRRKAFRFAPLHGGTFRRILSESTRRDLPDSLVLVLPDGSVHVRSAAVVRILRSLGGSWNVLGAVGSLAPRRILDLLYDAVAAIRGRLFPKPQGACPLVPASLRDRFAP